MAKERNAHGTRVARSITCAACGAADTVGFGARRLDRVLCRKCAAEQLGIEDEDANIRVERKLACTRCRRQESTTFAKPEEFLCRDCLRGIESTQKDRTRRAQRVGKVLRVRRGDE